MPEPKRKIEMPADIYSEAPAGAIEKLTGGGQPKRPPEPEPPPPAKTKPTRNLKPTSIYLTPEQLRKLDDLAYVYNGRHTDKRIDRQDIIRHLVNNCDIGSLQGL
jgi:hypothetical protein